MFSPFGSEWWDSVLESVATFSCHNVTVIMFSVWIGALAFKPTTTFFYHIISNFILFFFCQIIFLVTMETTVSNPQQHGDY
jgi:hypothetical protein